MKQKSTLSTIIKSILKLLVVLLVSTLFSLIIKKFSISNESVIMVFLLGILFVTILTSGYIYGLISSVASMMLFNYFFTEPRFTFLIYSSSDVILLGFFLVTAIISGTVTSRLQQQMNISHRNEMTTRLLYEVAGGFLHITGKRNIILKGITFIRENTGYQSTVEIEGEDDIYMDAQAVEDDFADALSVPIHGASRQLGVIRIKCNPDNLTLQQDLVLKTVASQLGIVLEREFNYNDRENIRIAMEREHLRSMLLRSIAHDLRSPLTALTGASALLADENSKLSPEEQKKLASDISEEMVWLTNLVENILNMTRISEGRLVLNKDEEVVDDVVNEALSHMSRFLAGRKVQVHLPDEIITLPMDGKLIAQVIINLLDNAIRHTPKDTAISIKVSMEGSQAMFEVADTGGGVNTSISGNLFDGFVAQNSKISDRKQGMGLGLSICKAIIQAHGGRIWVQNAEGGGARFMFTLPKKEDGSAG